MRSRQHTRPLVPGQELSRPATEEAPSSDAFATKLASQVKKPDRRQLRQAGPAPPACSLPRTGRTRARLSIKKHDNDPRLTRYCPPPARAGRRTQGAAAGAPPAPQIVRAVP